MDPMQLATSWLLDAGLDPVLRPDGNLEIRIGSTTVTVSAGVGREVVLTYYRAGAHVVRHVPV